MKLLITTLPDRAQAEALARELVEQGLAACAQIEAIHSLYRWDGQLCSEPEQRVLLKTSDAALPALLAAVRARHPYDLPALYTLSPDWSDPAFAAWVTRSCPPPR
ncbi:divalent-cation tolerance protein CutA [Pelomonas sp. CA6]|uniref:divalent-cation tolerance protein CutA n=1 Tax=Pelomonas sp. CA6 TaxID=2907999 RepID=UPI001F4B1176|nr:divalent-cation tolerance protein CutA [Pelomonas sp. CA6]MCH7342621.1 divalent-cation tolerance protein CutA [Pelomonas sp. CA6]